MGLGGLASSIGGLFGKGLLKTEDWLEKPENIHMLGTLGAAFSRPDIRTRGGQTFMTPSSGQMVGTAVAQLSGMQAYSAVTKQLSEGKSISEISEIRALSPTQLQSAIKLKQDIRTSEFGMVDPVIQRVKQITALENISDEQKSKLIEQVFGTIGLAEQAMGIEQQKVDIEQQRVDITETPEQRLTREKEITTLGTEAQLETTRMRVEGWIKEAEIRARTAYGEEAATTLVYRSAVGAANAAVSALMSRPSFRPPTQAEVENIWMSQFRAVMGTKAEEEGGTGFTVPAAKPIIQGFQ